ncbi:aminodeoxychorismate synthase, component I [Abditibacterium utsteinense]|uniref:aminodeoxychorismate synthase n=1 Tax=Abditibacterium utsteinense TaxID=1960156 RepID=A0A2S8SXI6_9BACT|nr:aminodeoxychorismate synthase component I [Abditibacterium utsteinense]PQV65478.1 aminodeoxychorismate synthase, component I [Abditibacterium utsteinense]
MMDFGCQTLDFEANSIRGEAAFALVESRGAASFWNDLRARLSESARKYPEGGAIGFVAYEATRSLEPRALPNLQSDDLSLPLARLIFYKKLRREKAALQSPISARDLPEFPDFPEARNFYESGVQTIKKYIAAGDIYQANLTRRFDFETDFSPAQIYQRLQSFGAAPRAALLEWNDFSIVSNSPETFLTLKNGVLEAKPIKGTIKRSSSALEDENLRAQLAQSAKNRAENVMIVDLMRNDLGRVCEFGSVHVPQLYQIESFPTLHHGVSTVRGRLRPNCTALDAFLAAFPCGSISGAPKIRAMQILNAIEPTLRGAAMGAIGYFAFNGDMEWNVAIRTATLIKNRAYFHVGGGIVADSQPAEEYDEMRLKARAIYAAISGN